MGVVPGEQGACGSVGGRDSGYADWLTRVRARLACDRDGANGAARLPTAAEAAAHPGASGARGRRAGRRRRPGASLATLIKELDEQFGQGAGAPGGPLARDRRRDPGPAHRAGEADQGPRRRPARRWRCAVDGPAAALIQHQAPEILARVNLFLGAGAVGQAAHRPGPGAQRRDPPPAAAAKARRRRRRRSTPPHEAELAAGLADAPDGAAEGVAAQARPRGAAPQLRPLTPAAYVDKPRRAADSAAPSTRPEAAPDDACSCRRSSSSPLCASAGSDRRRLRGAADRVGAGDMTLGNPNAKVTVIEYASSPAPTAPAWNEEVFPAFKAQVHRHRQGALRLPRVPDPAGAASPPPAS